MCGSVIAHGTIFPQPVEQLSRERPLSNIFNFYVLLSVLLQFALHIATLIYITQLSNQFEQYVPKMFPFIILLLNFLSLFIRRGPIDLDAKFAPSLLNTSIYLLGLSQQVSTFAINFQGRPFREGISENRALWWGLVGASAVAFCGATDFVPELNRWLQIVEMENIVSLVKHVSPSDLLTLFVLVHVQTDDDYDHRLRRVLYH